MLSLGWRLAYFGLFHIDHGTGSGSADRLVSNVLLNFDAVSYFCQPA